MKRKGFTLIELLAVIVILAIIALIATPIIMNVIENTKEASYDRSVENILHSANIFTMDMKVTEDLTLDQNIYDKIVNQIQGDRPEEGQVYVNKKGEIALSLRYGDYCYTKSYGEKSYYKEKTEDTCITPFYYLRGQSTSNPNAYFLNPFGDDTKPKIKKSEIETITTVASNVVPENAAGSWDVTADSKGNVNEDVKGKVMAWYKDEDNNGLYEVYIGQEGGVKVYDGYYLFADLTNLTEIDLSKMDTSNVTDMMGMFKNCNKIKKLELKNFNTSNVVKMSYMFMNSYDLVSLDLRSFDTSNVTNMSYLFSGCYALTKLDLSSFDTRNVQDMRNMFIGNGNLTSLDLRSFDTQNVTDMSNLFSSCTNLNEILVSDNWTTENTDTFDMFHNCGTNHVTLK